MLLTTGPTISHAIKIGMPISYCPIRWSIISISKIAFRSIVVLTFLGKHGNRTDYPVKCYTITINSRRQVDAQEFMPLFHVASF